MLMRSWALTESSVRLLKDTSFARNFDLVLNRHSTALTFACCPKDFDSRIYNLMAPARRLFSMTEGLEIDSFIGSMDQQILPIYGRITLI